MSLVRKVGYEIVLLLGLVGAGGILSVAIDSAVLILLPYVLFLVGRVIYQRRTGRSAIDAIMLWDHNARMAEAQRTSIQRTPTRLDFLLSGAWQLIGILLAVLLVVYGLALFTSQVIAWLKFDQWIAISLRDLFLPHALSGPNEPFPVSLIPEWLQGDKRIQEYFLAPRPGTWLGLRKLILWIMAMPLSAASFLLGLVIPTMFRNGSGRS